MDAAERKGAVAELDRAFGGANDVSPSPNHDLHVLFNSLELPDPWTPSPTRALAIFTNWPGERPLFFIDDAVVGETNEPPRSHQLAYHLDEAWRSFSWAFPWKGGNPVRAIQLWMNRFVQERS
jgi:hypothetical protein